MNCLKCTKALDYVPRPEYLNSYQWDAIKLGDYFYEGKCEENQCVGKLNDNGCIYFWKDKLYD